MSIAGTICGLWSAVSQHRMIVNAQPADAVVLANNVDVHRGQHVTEYKPVVKFEYVIDGETYRSEKTTPQEESGRQWWAEQVIREHPRGKQVRAWVPTGSPEDAFLLRRYDSMPYTAMLFGVLMSAAAYVIYQESKPKRPRFHESRDIKGSDDSVTLIGDVSQYSWQFFVLLGGFWLVIGVPVCGHYLYVMQPPVQILFVLYAVSYHVCAIGLVLYGLLQRHRVDRFTNTVVQLESRTAADLGAAGFEVSQTVEFDGTLKELKLKLAALVPQKSWAGGTMVDDDRILYEEEKTIELDRMVRAGDHWRETVKFSYPADCVIAIMAAGDRVLWRLDLQVTASTWGRFKDRFYVPIELAKEPEFPNPAE